MTKTTDRASKSAPESAGSDPEAPTVHDDVPDEPAEEAAPVVEEPEVGSHENPIAAAEGLPDVAPEPHVYYVWGPIGLPDGLYTHPTFGEIIPGRVLALPRSQAHLVDGHPEWRRSTKQKHDNQPTLEEEKLRFQPAYEEAQQ